MFPSNTAKPDLVVLIELLPKTPSETFGNQFAPLTVQSKNWKNHLTLSNFQGQALLSVDPNNFYLHNSVMKKQFEDFWNKNPEFYTYYVRVFYSYQCRSIKMFSYLVYCQFCWLFKANKNACTGI